MFALVNAASCKTNADGGGNQTKMSVWLCSGCPQQICGTALPSRKCRVNSKVPMLLATALCFATRGGLFIFILNPRSKEGEVVPSLPGRDGYVRRVPFQEQLS